MCVCVSFSFTSWVTFPWTPLSNSFYLCVIQFQQCRVKLPWTPLSNSFYLCVIQFHQLGKVPVDSGLENKYLNTEAEKKASGVSGPAGSQPTSSSSSRRNKRKRGGKGKKRRRRRKGKKKRRNSKRKNRKSRKESSDSGGFDVTSPSSPDSRTTGISYQV